MVDIASSYRKNTRGHSHGFYQYHRCLLTMVLILGIHIFKIMAYCTLNDLKLVVSQNSFDSMAVTDGRLSSIILAKGAFIDSCFKSAGFITPIVSSSYDVNENAVKLCLWEAVKSNFFKDDTNTQSVFEADYKEALEFFGRLSNGTYTPSYVLDSASPTVTSTDDTTTFNFVASSTTGW